MFIENQEITVYIEDLNLGVDFPHEAGKALISGFVFYNAYENLIIDPIKFEVEIKSEQGDILGYLDLIKVTPKDSVLMGEINEALEREYDEKKSQD